jgi:nucleoporin SEH1
MAQVSSFSTHHLDIIHDTAYDYYGNMVASGSSDQKISVLEKDGDSWSINDNWKAHDAAILKVSWSHPEYGKVLASCGMDKTVRIWQENSSEKKGNGRRWVEKCRMVEARGPVQDVQFAPQFLGLKIVFLKFIIIGMRRYFWYFKNIRGIRYDFFNRLDSNGIPLNFN